jgi:ABC-type dipeptide/oligopeptide/nickel transport system permease component
MLRIFLRRLLILIPTALFGSILIFALVQIIPGGAAETIAGDDSSPETIARIRTQLGLDRPLHEQYLQWLGDALQGDFGRSLLDNRSIGADIADRFPHTLELAVAALGIALMIGVPLGIASAIYRRSTVDSAITSLSGLALAIPEFWMAMISINLFAIKLAWFPATGLEPWSAGWDAHVNSMVMPTLTLSSGAAAVITRFTRSGMIGALDSHYIRTARSVGLSPVRIYLQFAFKNALVPVVTVVGIVAGSLIGGAVLVEQVFVIPGLGAMLVGGVLQKDYPTVQSVALVLTIAVILINLVVDMACLVLDPRTRN